MDVGKRLSVGGMIGSSKAASSRGVHFVLISAQVVGGIVGLQILKVRMLFDEKLGKGLNATHPIHRRKIVHVWKSRLLLLPKRPPFPEKIPLINYAAANLLNGMLRTDCGTNGQRMQLGQRSRRGAMQSYPPWKTPPSLRCCSQNHP